jgi:hypothetical protein
MLYGLGPLAVGIPGAEVAYCTPLLLFAAQNAGPSAVVAARIFPALNAVSTVVEVSTVPSAAMRSTTRNVAGAAVAATEARPGAAA